MECTGSFLTYGNSDIRALRKRVGTVVMKNGVWLGAKNQASRLDYFCDLSQETSSAQKSVCASDEDKNEYGETYPFLKVRQY